MNDDNTPIAELLEPPNTFMFSVRHCVSAFKLNQFSIGLKNPDERALFLADERAAMMAYRLSDSQMDMIEQRDWTGLIAGGGHVLAIVKIAYSLGIMHHEVGAHMCGMPYQALKALLPRESGLLPQDIDPEEQP